MSLSTDNIDCQCPLCKSGKVAIIAQTLMCLNCGHREYLYDYRNAYDDPMPQKLQPDNAELEDRVCNLEAISAQPGRIPRQYHNQLQQIRGEVTNLATKVAKISNKERQRTASP